MSGRKGASAKRPTTALVLSQSQSEEPSPAPRAWARGAKKRAAPTSMEDVRLAFDAEVVKLLKVKPGGGEQRVYLEFPPASTVPPHLSPGYREARRRHPAGARLR